MRGAAKVEVRVAQLARALLQPAQPDRPPTALFALGVVVPGAWIAAQLVVLEVAGLGVSGRVEDALDVPAVGQDEAALAAQRSRATASQGVMWSVMPAVEWIATLPRSTAVPLTSSAPGRVSGFSEQVEQAPRARLHKEDFQASTSPASAPVAKPATTVLEPAQVPYVFQKAFQLMRSDRPGPVLIDLPFDVQMAEIEFDIDAYEPLR